MRSGVHCPTGTTTLQYLLQRLPLVSDSRERRRERERGARRHDALSPPVSVSRGQLEVELCERPSWVRAGRGEGTERERVSEPACKRSPTNSGCLGVPPSLASLPSPLGLIRFFCLDFTHLPSSPTASRYVLAALPLDRFLLLCLCFIFLVPVSPARTPTTHYLAVSGRNAFH